MGLGPLTFNKMAEEIKKRSLDEKIQELPKEFLLFGEQYKDKHFEKTLDLVNKVLENGGINTLEEKYKNGFITLFRMIHAWGFYAGMDYTIAPWEKYDENEL